MRFIYLLLSCVLPFLNGFGFENSSNSHDLSKYFGNHDGCFVLFDSRKNAYIRYRPDACKKEVSPCSTFKIPNTLIGLETGVISDQSFSLKWDGVVRRIKVWNKDHDLKSAFQNSVVWYYQEVAKRIGPKRMKTFLKRLHYGNEDISGGIDRFWLDSTLKISANEQVILLRRLWNDTLPFCPKNQKICREIMEITKVGDATLYGKTGTAGDLAKNITTIGWFVGCVITSQNKVFFATRLADKQAASGKEARRISEAILYDLGYLPSK